MNGPLVSNQTAHLLIQAPLGEQLVYPLARETTVGRYPENKIVLNDASVSGRHAEIVCFGNSYTLRDKNSSNGTTVNQRPIKEVKLSDGDVIRFGGVEARFAGPRTFADTRTASSDDPELLIPTTESSAKVPASRKRHRYLVATVIILIAAGYLTYDHYFGDESNAKEMSVQALPKEGAPADLSREKLEGRDPQQVRDQAAEDWYSGNYRAAELNYRWLLERTPNDPFLKANLAFNLTRQNKHAEAIPIYEGLIKEGDATYDLFAYYAVSLQATGKDEEAIAWNYRALSVVPTLTDVRQTLAKLLVKHGRPYEALSLLASFDSTLEAKGDSAYFKAQRIAIQTSLPKVQNTTALTDRSAKIEGHFYFVLSGTNSESIPFLVDTGASHTVMSPQTLEALGFTIPQNAKHLTLTIADNRQISGEEFELPWLRLGPFQLKNVPVVICANAPPLLGQSTLARFDLMTQQDNGCEFLTLRQRSSE